MFWKGHKCTRKAKPVSACVSRLAAKALPFLSAGMSRNSINGRFPPRGGNSRCSHTHGRELRMCGIPDWQIGKTGAEFRFSCAVIFPVCEGHWWLWFYASNWPESRFMCAIKRHLPSYQHHLLFNRFCPLSLVKLTQ